MLFRRKDTQAKMRIRPEIAIFLDDPRVPYPDAVLGGMYEEVCEGPPPTLEELKRDPDIQVVMEAAKMIARSRAE